MALATNEELITEALELAGDSSLKPRALFWLNNWVASESGKVPWPHTLQTVGPLVADGGATQFLLGASGDLLNRVHSVRGLRHTTGAGLVGAQLHFRDSEEVRGMATSAWLREFERTSGLQVNLQNKGKGVWAVNFSPALTRSLSFMAYLQLIPATQTLLEVSDYPNAETLVHAIYCAALKHQNDERQMVEETKLMRMVSEDRAVYLKLGGSSQHFPLSSRTFPGRRR